MFKALFKISVVFLLHEITAIEGENEPSCYTLSRILPCRPFYQYRTIDGSCNNLEHPSWGKAYWPYRRLMPATYSDGKYAFKKQSSGDEYPSARVVSNILFKPGDMQSEKFTILHMQTAQFLTHDLALADGTQAAFAHPPPPGCCGSDSKYGYASNTSQCSDIDIPPGDPDYGEGYQCMQFARTVTTKKFNCGIFNKAEEQITIVTSYIDLSTIYGSVDILAKKLRSFSGGKLKSEMRDGQEWPPNVPTPKLVCTRAKSEDDACYQGGDLRLNQNPQLTVLQVVLFRYHNKVASGLAVLNPTWSDERLYQEARKILIAIFQNIAFGEVLPEYIGKDAMVANGLLYPDAVGCVDDYDKYASATVRQEFATAAWRKFHSEVVGKLIAMNQERKVTGFVRMTEWMDAGGILELNKDVNLNTLLVGCTKQAAYESDPYFTHDIKFRIGPNDTTHKGIDLESYDVQRGRDHGLPNYLTTRRYCNLTVPKSWDDFSPDIPPEYVQKLKEIYKTIDDVELYSAGVLEKNVPGALSGPTFQCLIIIQFKLTRTGDRFFYQNCESHRFTTEQLESIKKVTLARVLCDTTNVEQLQQWVTKVPNESNPLYNCSDLPFLNITLWKSDEKEPNNKYLKALYKIFSKVKDYFKL